VTQLRIDRRRLLAGSLLAAAPASSAASEDLKGQGMPWRANTAASPDYADRSRGWLYFTPAEVAFVHAACARIIPADELGPGAVEADVPLFLDRQMAGEYGQASRWYMQGPWAKGEATQGYQSRMTPAQMYRAAIKAIDEEAARTGGGTFAALAAADQDALLKRLEAGQVELSGGVDAKGFFALMLQNVIEGYFSDPIYGGNRDMVGWKLIGFRGARYDNRALVLRHGQPDPLPPVGIAGRPGWSGKV
jgi:gluconate 2-dehydrogenase gamma chain